MKVLILAPFAAAIISSIIWYEGAERNCLTITRTRKGRRRKSRTDLRRTGDGQIGYFSFEIG
jgi:hypothetical protein